MIKYIILGIALFILFIVIIVIIVNSNKLKEIKIKLDEAEENIGLILSEKFILLSKINKALKSKSDDEYFKDLDNTNIEEIDNIELNRKLASYDNIIVELSEYNKDFEYDEEEIESFEKLNTLNINRLATEKYYNDTVVTYNKLLKKFPAKIIAKFKGYKKKESFSNEKEEMFEILKS